MATPSHPAVAATAAAAPTPATPKRPGGARPIPNTTTTTTTAHTAAAINSVGSVAVAGGSGTTSIGRGCPPSKLSIPEGNVPGMNVDQANEGGWHIPSASLPALALRPIRATPSLAASSSSRPKLTLSAAPTPPLLPTRPTTVPSSRPALLLEPVASSAGSASSRGATPLLKLAIPTGGQSGAASSGFSSNDYPDDDNASQLRTPVPGEDRDATVHARSTSRYAGAGESSYGGGGAGSDSDQMSAMTEDIRQAMSRMRFDSSPAPSFSNLPRSRAGSTAGSQHGSQHTPSRRGSLAPGDDLSSLRSLRVSTPTRELDDASGVEDTSYDVQEFDPAEFRLIRRLGEGTGGSVDLVEDPRSGQVMARKVIARTANPAMHKQVLRELEFLSACSSPYIVEHYGAFLAERDTQICILMEYCAAGSLDSLLGKMKQTGMRCSEHVLGRIASSVLRGLDYLRERRIVHRDIKPSNILLTRAGVVKLCDFGVSGELVDSIAGTFTGTSYYMAPERIQGKPYSITADVWSLGLTLHEVAHLRFPFPPEGESQSVAPIELLSYIVTAPVPAMVDDPVIGRKWTSAIRDFMACCLIRSGTDRPYPHQLLTHEFITRSEAKNVNMAKWVAALCPP